MAAESSSPQDGKGSYANSRVWPVSSRARCLLPDPGDRTTRVANEPAHRAGLAVVDGHDEDAAAADGMAALCDAREGEVAELAQTALTAAGIPSVVAADDAGGAYPFDLTGAARLLVDEADAEDAAELLQSGSHADREEHDEDDARHHSGFRAAESG
jgi:Putative prokaryotic signal transducing protein